RDRAGLCLGHENPRASAVALCRPHAADPVGQRHRGPQLWLGHAGGLRHRPAQCLRAPAADPADAAGDGADAGAVPLRHQRPDLPDDLQPAGGLPGAWLSARLVRLGGLQPSE
ncbi:hypothetical protein OY671_011654, partial [Metschnikowia pulcherrima]